MDDLVTSQLIEGRDFPDCEMLDANIASALKRIISNPCFRRRVTVEEQKAQKDYRFLRGRQIAYMINDHFRATSARDVALDLSDLFNVSFKGCDIQDFDTRWDHALLSASEVPAENLLEGLCNMKIRESVQLQTVSAMYEQEIDRDRAMPSHQRLKTLVSRHIDRTIRTRNFRARSIGSKVTKGRMSAKRGKMGECYQWKANGQCSRGDSCSFRHGSDRGQRPHSSSPAVTKSRKGRKVGGTWENAISGKAIGQCAEGDSCSFSHDGASGNRCDQRQKRTIVFSWTKGAHTD